LLLSQKKAVLKYRTHFFPLLCAFLLIGFSNSAQPALQWAKQIGALGFDRGEDVAVDANGNVYVAGSFEETVDFDPGPGTYTLYSAGWNMYVAKYDVAGNFVWARTIASATEDKATAIVVNSSGVYVATERFILLSHYDHSGNFFWTKSFGGTGFAELVDIRSDLLGNILLTGNFTGTVDFDMGPSVYPLSSKGGNDAFVAKIDAYGDFVWAKSFGGTSTWDRPQAVTTDNSSNVYTIGFFDLTVDFDPGPGTFNMVTAGETDIFILKLDQNGNFLWARRLGAESYDYGGMDIVTDHQANVFATGYFHSTIDFD
jgi:hypothetical protein